MDDTGFEAAPSRYMATGREAIDVIREELGDERFAGFCRGTARKYRLRAGHKAGAPEGNDLEKARWYEMMADHVESGTPDPRTLREAGTPAPAARGRTVPVLDHGFVRLVESWGHGDHGTDMEAGIIEAARQSTQGSFRGWDQDEKLLGFLHRNKHATPFEFAGMVIEVRAPIFVFREWHRHRTQSYNEMSARYSPLPDQAYVPTVERIMLNAGKQGGAVAGTKPIGLEMAERVRHDMEQAYQIAEFDYQQFLREGVPKELARCVLPVGRYSQMRASACLRNWLAFLTLRLDPAAQWEIRQYAEAVGQIIAQEFPRTWALFGSTR